jgi:hypothetical protein
VNDTAQVLGSAVIGLCTIAAQRWANGDTEAAERIAAAAWRLVGNGTYLEDSTNP